MFIGTNTAPSVRVNFGVTLNTVTVDTAQDNFIIPYEYNLIFTYVFPTIYSYSKLNMKKSGSETRHDTILKLLSRNAIPINIPEIKKYFLRIVHTNIVKFTPF